MPICDIIAKELADVLSVIAHPARLRIIEELSQGEIDVSGLVKLTGLPQATVSQHLAALRNRKLVHDRREGRGVFYSLSQPWMADWMLDGLKLIVSEGVYGSELAKAASKARRVWLARKK
ncbi:MAG: metalloregulator ArsR/SmtB family transcription factor [Planctomycetota bacterium]|nr:metalloregulator ArsR/SmtB family transcription factor [Planctomycetota bacterium]